MRRLAIIGAVAAIAAGCGGDSDTRDYPAGVRDNFLTNCIDSGGIETSCECALDSLEERYTFGEFASDEQTYLRTGIVPAGWYDAMAECSDK